MMRFATVLLGWLAVWGPLVVRGAELTRVETGSALEVFAWDDTCNVYVLRDGEEGLLVNVGDGSVLEKLDGLGVKRVEWVLFTDHHREQCQGVGLLDRSVTQVAAPEAERDLFETPAAFRKWYPKLGDRYTVHAASYVRPPSQPIRLDRGLENGEVFSWRGMEIRCVATPGHSPGGMTFEVTRDGKTVAFSGGVIHDGARFTNWYDTEWDYGFAKGIDALIGSVDMLARRQPDLLLPSQGPPVAEATSQLRLFSEKLTAFRMKYVRGYPVFDMPIEKSDPISQPTASPHVRRVTPHLYKLSHDHPGKNFAILISDSGKGLVLDCGLIPELLLHKIIADLKRHMGLKEIDAMWISHMHGDHFLLGPVLREKYGAEMWTLDRIADVCENPRHYDYAALVSSYGDGFDGMKIDKKFRDGESVEWEGYTVQVDWMPGQTEFGCCLWLEIDGKRIAFTGDNLFADSSDPSQDGHEAVVARNSAVLEEGYVYGSRYLKELAPDLVMGSHSYVMPEPAGLLGRYHDWSKEILRLYKELLPHEHYEYLYDPYWVSAYPYRIDLREEKARVVTVTVRNFKPTAQRHRVALKLPAGVVAEPAVLKGEVPGESERAFEVRLKAAGEVEAGVQIVPFDITLDGERHGERFDFLVLGKEGELGK